MDRCNVCESPLGDAVYVTAGDVSITSLAEVRPGRTTVRACAACGQLCTPPAGDLESYYAQEYRLLLDSVEEDQLYAVVDGHRLFRAEHQARTLLQRTALPEGARVLDYGCGKGATADWLTELRPDLRVHLFEVSETYRSFWGRRPANRCAVGSLPDAWRGRFDLVASFFVLEHVAAPLELLVRMTELLAPGGLIYLLVPNVWANPADLIVADHVSHFTVPSLRALLARAGLRAIELEGDVHAGAWLVRAVRADDAEPVPVESEAGREDPAREARRAVMLGEQWREASDRVRAFEAEDAGPDAIYGAGFYGTFITTCLRSPEAIECVVDANPHRQGGDLLGRPIVAPEQLPDAVRRVYVGLNPRCARAIIDDLGAWRQRRHEYLFL